MTLFVMDLSAAGIPPPPPESDLIVSFVVVVANKTVVEKEI
jgi:hypothetical protein